MNTLDFKNSIGPQEKSAANVKKYDSFKERIFHQKSDMPMSKIKLINLKRRKYDELKEKSVALLFEEQMQLKPTEIKRIDVKSTFHVLFKVITKNGDYVIKINSTPKLYKDYPFYLELFIQNKLKEIGSSFINIFKIDLSRDKYPFDFMIMSYLEGKNLESYKEENENKMYFLLGKIFKKIHALEVSNFGQIDYELFLKKNILSGKSKKWTDFFYRNLDKHLDLAKKIGVISKEEKLLIESLFYKNNKLFLITKPSLIHNDPSSRNIFTDGKTIIGIIDWEDAIIGDPLWELAFIETFLYRDEDLIKFKNFCQGYGVKLKDLKSSSKYNLYYLRVVIIKTISRYMSGYENDLGFQIDKMRVDKAIQNLR